VVVAQLKRARIGVGERRMKARPSHSLADRTLGDAEVADIAGSLARPRGDDERRTLLRSI
jgi:hypothetical protein